MIRLVSTVSLLIAFAFLVSCQSYSTGLQQSMARADETSAVAAMKTISTAQQAYAISNSGSYGTFQQLCVSGHLDERFNSTKPEIKDYVLSMEVGENSYALNADPTGAGGTAGRHLYMDSSSPLIRVNATQPATAKDSVLQP